MMKKIILLSVAACAGFSAIAQIRGGDNYYAQRYLVDLNFPVGLVMQTPTNSINTDNYSRPLNVDIPKLKMGTGISYGVEAQFGYFIGKKRRFGIGTGISYLKQRSDATLGNYHIEYADFDNKRNIYRQVIQSTNNSQVREKLDMTCINIPVVLKFKQRFSTKIGFTMDAGILYNLQRSNKWTTEAKFDYEAIYQFAKDAVTGATITVYDDQSVPSKYDYLATRAMYERTHSIGTVESIFDSLRNVQGYNVALNATPTDKSGTISYKTGSIGFIIRPAINVRIQDRLHANLGAYFSYQSFNNNTVTDYKLTQNLATKYSTLLNTVSSVTNTSMGISVGFRYFIGEAKDSDFDGMYDE
jgi:hypothetical protein